MCGVVLGCDLAGALLPLFFALARPLITKVQGRRAFHCFGDYREVRARASEQKRDSSLPSRATRAATKPSEIRRTIRRLRDNAWHPTRP